MSVIIYRVLKWETMFVCNSLCGFNGFSLLNQYYLLGIKFEIVYDVKTIIIQTTLY